MIRAGVIGATGYTGIELVKLLRGHPEVELAWLTSESYAGRTLSQVYPCSWHDPLLPLARAPLTKADLVFVCLPHAASMKAVATVRKAGVKAIDLSADFRLRDPMAYEHWYATPHTEKDLLAEAVYGLPELYRDKIAGSELVANPGCYPTSVILALWPLAQLGWLSGQVIVDSKSGVSGAGRKPKLMTSFVEANENLSPYSIGYAHRHIAEMEQELSFGGGMSQVLSTASGKPRFIFSPHLVPVSRGILSTIYLTLPEGVGEADLFFAFGVAYETEPFVQVLPGIEPATMKHSAGSNRCVIGLTPVPGTRTLIITSSIDNLLKGAAGQALQNMNVVFGLDETLGLP
ncbi:MAG: N-acetyl-gamma-glutamyl-phosphate reductase [Chloroflexota bacterium]|nr:N-acetyl-gamma-glutamyl-phosphate reductase [Chloroflexota bacterium]